MPKSSKSSKSSKIPQCPYWNYSAHGSERRIFASNTYMAVFYTISIIRRNFTEARITPKHLLQSKIKQAYLRSHSYSNHRLVGQLLSLPDPPTQPLLFQPQAWLIPIAICFHKTNDIHRKTTHPAKSIEHNLILCHISISNNSESFSRGGTVEFLNFLNFSAFMQYAS